MSHADIITSDLERKENKIRKRKKEKSKYSSSSSSSKMVGFGNGESLSKALADVSTELTVDSDADSADDDDTRHLIKTNLPRVSIIDGNNSIKKFKIHDNNAANDDNEDDDENVWTISVQMFIPFILAGLGMVAASLLLDIVQVNIYYFQNK